MVQTHLGAPMYIVLEEQSEKRLDQFLAEASGESRSYIKRCIDAGVVFCDSKKMNKGSYRVAEGEEYRIEALPEEEVAIQPKNMPADSRLLEKIRVLKETEDYLLIDKPAGLLTHPTEKESYSLVTWILEKYPELADVGEDAKRPGIVHRLDRHASGILVLAKTQKMFMHLKKQFQDRTTEKYYTVLVHDQIAADHDTIDFLIDRGKSGAMVARPHVKEVTLSNVSALQDGKESLTEFWVEKRLVNHSLLRVRIHSGRTHQIRVHMHAYNHPVVGDTLYTQKRFLRKKESGLDRLFLCATTFAFTDLSGERVETSIQLPDVLQEYFHSLAS